MCKKSNCINEQSRKLNSEWAGKGWLSEMSDLSRSLSQSQVMLGSGKCRRLSGVSSLRVCTAVPSPEMVRCSLDARSQFMEGRTDVC